MSLESSTVVLPNPSPVYPGTPAELSVPAVQATHSVPVAGTETPRTASHVEESSDETDSVLSFASPRSIASSFLELDTEAAGTSTTGDMDDFDFVDDESTDDEL